MSQRNHPSVSSTCSLESHDHHVLSHSFHPVSPPFSSPLPLRAPHPAHAHSPIRSAPRRYSGEKILPLTIPSPT
jgi:hypothetical protein